MWSPGGSIGARNPLKSVPDSLDTGHAIHSGNQLSNTNLNIKHIVKQLFCNSYKSKLLLYSLLVEEQEVKLEQQQSVIQEQQKHLEEQRSVVELTRRQIQTLQKGSVQCTVYIHCTCVHCVLCTVYSLQFSTVIGVLLTGFPRSFSFSPFRVSLFLFNICYFL